MGTMLYTIDFSVKDVIDVWGTRDGERKNYYGKGDLLSTVIMEVDSMETAIVSIEDYVREEFGDAAKIGHIEFREVKKIYDQDKPYGKITSLA